MLLLFTNKYKTQNSQYFLKIFFKFAQIIEVFDHSPFSLKARSMAEHCRPKHGIKFSVIFLTVRFRIVLSIFGEKEESNLMCSVKETNRCWWKCGVYLCAFGSIQCIQRRSGIMHFRRIRRLKRRRSVFAENTEWNGAFLAITRYWRKSN